MDSSVAIIHQVCSHSCGLCLWTDTRCFHLRVTTAAAAVLTVQNSCFKTHNVLSLHPPHNGLSRHQLLNEIQLMCFSLFNRKTHNHRSTSSKEHSYYFAKNSHGKAGAHSHHKSLLLLSPKLCLCAAVSASLLTSVRRRCWRGSWRTCGRSCWAAWRRPLSCRRATTAWSVLTSNLFFVFRIQQGA